MEARGMGVLTRWGCGTVIAGLLASLVGFRGNRHTDEDKCANIGAGLLQFAGVALLAVGVILAVCGLLQSKRLRVRRDSSDGLRQ